MSKLAHPPKLRSYVDHKPHSAADNLMKWGRPWKTYFDHYPVNSTDLFQPHRKIFNSYLDHFARPGDLNQM